MKRNDETPPGETGSEPDRVDPLSTRHLRANLKTRAVSGVLVTASTQGAKLTLQMVYIAIMSRLLQPADFGIIAMVTSVVAILGVVRDGGLTTATIQRAEISQHEVTGMFWVNVALGVLLALFTAALSPAFAWFYQIPQLSSLVLAYSLTFLIAGLQVQQEALLRRSMRFKALALVDLGTLLGSSVTGVAFALSGFGYWSIAIGALTGSAVHASLLWLVSDWRPGGPTWPTGLGSMLRFGGHVMGYNLVSALGMNLDKVLLGRFAGSAELGFYSRAQVLLIQPFSQLLAPLGSVAIPTLSRIHTETEKFQQTILRLLLVIGFASAFVSSFLFAGADWIVRIVLGEAWSETATIFRAFAVTVFTMPISVVATWALTTAGLGRALSFWGIVNNGILLGAIVCGLPWGAFGVALAYSVSGIILRVPLLYVFVAGKANLGLHRLLRVVAPAFIAFAILSSSFYALARPYEDANPIYGLIALFLGTMLSAALAIFGSSWGRDVRRTINELAPGLIPRRMRT